MISGIYPSNAEFSVPFDAFRDHTFALSSQREARDVPIKLITEHFWNITSETQSQFLHAQNLVLYTSNLSRTLQSRTAFHRIHHPHQILQLKLYEQPLHREKPLHCEQSLHRARSLL